MKTFQDYLKDVHSSTYNGLDDDMIDNYESWLVHLDFSEIVDMANEYCIESNNAKKDPLEFYRNFNEEMRYDPSPLVSKDTFERERNYKLYVRDQIKELFESDGTEEFTISKKLLLDLLLRLPSLRI